MNSLKWLIPGLLALVAASAVAMEGGSPGPDFQASKAKQVQMLEKKLACLKAANSHQDMAQCHEAAKQDHKQQEQQMIQEQRRKLDERERRLKEGK